MPLRRVPPNFYAVRIDNAVRIHYYFISTHHCCVLKRSCTTVHKSASLRFMQFCTVAACWCRSGDSVARVMGFSNDRFISNFLESVLVNEFRKCVNSCCSFRLCQKAWWRFFDSRYRLSLSSFYYTVFCVLLLYKIT